MKDETTTGKPELVIVRRRATDDSGGGKAGAWKIAYADFVTAMMAFFLVMWLINASNEETRAQVASYFNPIKLTDTSTGTRSLKDSRNTRSSQSSGDPQPEEPSASAEDMARAAALMSNPPKALDEIEKLASRPNPSDTASEAQPEIAPAAKPDASNPGVGDPFDPRTWESVKSDHEEESAASATGDEPGAGGEALQKADELSAELPDPVVETDERKSTGTRVNADRPGDAAEQEAAAIAAEITSRLGSQDDPLKQLVSVTPSPGGVLISLTEGENFEMFETGSAEPRPDALRLVKAIAETMQSRDGYLVIRGHTDARPYRNGFYDNWQLSTARAHFARYMLLRSGLDEKRIQRIEGVADREPRNSEDPQAAENRRIEIFVGREMR